MPNESIGGISVSIAVGLQDLQRQLQQAQAMSEQAGKAMAAAFNSSAGTLTQLGGAASEASVKVESLSSSLSSAASGLTNAGLVMSTLSAGILGVGVAALETAGKFEQWEVSFTRLLGSEKAAKDMLSELVDFATRTPFEIPSVVSNAQKLMAFGFAAKDVVSVLTTLGDAASGLSKGAAGLNSMVLAFGEMEAKGVVQLRQLNMLTNQGVKAIEILATAYDMSTQQMSAAITKKLIPSAQAIPILLAGINKQFGGMMEAQSQTLLGMWSNLADATTKTLNALGQTMLPLFKKLEQGAFSLLNAVQRIAEWFGRLPVPVQATALGLAAVVAAIGPLLLGLGALSFAIKSLVELPAAITALGSAMGLMSANTAAAGVAAAVTAPAAEALAAAETVLVEATTAANFQLNLFQEELAAAAAEATIAGTQFTLLGEEIGAIAVTSAESGTAMAATAAGGMSAMSIGAAALAVSLAAIIGYKLGGWAYEQIPGLKSLADNFTTFAFVTIPGYQAAMEKLLGVHLDLNRNMEGSAEAIANLQRQLASLHITVDRGTMSEEQYITALIKARDAHKEQDVSISAEEQALSKLHDTYGVLEDAVTKARGVLALAAVGLKEGTVSSGEYAIAANDLEQAIKKLASAQGEHATATKHSKDETKNWNDVISASLGLGAKNTEIVTSLGAAFKYLGDQVAAADELWKHYIVDAGQALDIMAKGTGTVGGFTVSMENGVEMIKGSAEALQTTSGKILDFTSAETEASGAVGGLTSSLDSQASAFDHLGVTAETAGKRTHQALTGLEDGFKATTGQVDALSVGISFLAMQMSGWTALAGSGGLNQGPGGGNPADLEHQLWLARNMTGDPMGQLGSIAIPSKFSGAMKALETATTSVGTAAANTTASLTQYVDGMGNVYDSYQQMVDAIDKNPALGGLFTTVTKSMSDFAGIPIRALSSGVDGLTSSVDSLGTSSTSAASAILSVAASQQTLADTVVQASGAFARSSNGWAENVDEVTGRLAADTAMLQKAIATSYNDMAHQSQGTQVQGEEPGTFHATNGAPGSQAAMALIPLTKAQAGSPSSPMSVFGDTAIPQQNTPNVTMTMNYPSFNNQQQTDQIMKQVVTQLRTVVGSKL